MSRPTISALIIDDEPLARKRVENLLYDVSEIEIKALIGTGKEAISAINLLRPNIIFLDVQLKDLTGFQVLDSLSNDPPIVIFVTAFDTYAIKAFEVFAFDYLLKPYTEERFYSSVKKALLAFERSSNQNYENTIAGLLGYINNQPKIVTGFGKRIPIPGKKKTLFVRTEDIVYIKASNYYIEIYTDKSKHVLRESMHTIIQVLDPQNFIRIHRSSIVNLTHIAELINSSYAELDIKMTDGELLRVSKGYKKEFLQRVGIK